MNGMLKLMSQTPTNRDLLQRIRVEIRLRVELPTNRPVRFDRRKPRASNPLGPLECSRHWRAENVDGTNGSGDSECTIIRILSQPVQAAAQGARDLGDCDS